MQSHGYSLGLTQSSITINHVEIASNRCVSIEQMMRIVPILDRQKTPIIVSIERLLPVRLVGISLQLSR